MSMVLQISCDAGCLCVKATGKFSLAEAKRTFLEVVKAVEEHGVGKVLFDADAQPTRVALTDTRVP